MNHQLISLGIVVLLIGFGIIIIGSLIGPQKSETKVAVGGFIGFIPFGWSNDKRLLWAIIVLTALISLVWLFTHLRISNP